MKKRTSYALHMLFCFTYLQGSGEQTHPYITEAREFFLYDRQVQDQLVQEVSAAQAEESAPLVLNVSINQNHASETAEQTLMQSAPHTDPPYTTDAANITQSSPALGLHRWIKNNPLRTTCACLIGTYILIKGYLWKLSPPVNKHKERIPLRSRFLNEEASYLAPNQSREAAQELLNKTCQELDRLHKYQRLVGFLEKLYLRKLFFLPKIDLAETAKRIHELETLKLTISDRLASMPYHER